MYNKSTINKYIDKPVMISYYWNGYKHNISAVIKISHYKVTFRKLDSTITVSIRYNQIENIELINEEIGAI
jgi:hypothetical protein